MGYLAYNICSTHPIIKVSENIRFKGCHSFSLAIVALI